MDNHTMENQLNISMNIVKEIFLPEIILNELIPIKLITCNNIFKLHQPKFKRNILFVTIKEHKMIIHSHMRDIKELDVFSCLTYEDLKEEITQLAQVYREEKSHEIWT